MASGSDTWSSLRASDAPSLVSHARVMGKFLASGTVHCILWQIKGFKDIVNPSWFVGCQTPEVMLNHQMLLKPLNNLQIYSNICAMCQWLNYIYDFLSGSWVWGIWDICQRADSTCQQALQASGDWWQAVWATGQTFSCRLFQGVICDSNYVFENVIYSVLFSRVWFPWL